MVVIFQYIAYITKRERSLFILSFLLELLCFYKICEERKINKFQI